MNKAEFQFHTLHLIQIHLISELSHIVVSYVPVYCETCRRVFATAPCLRCLPIFTFNIVNMDMVMKKGKRLHIRVPVFKYPKLVSAATKLNCRPGDDVNGFFTIGPVENQLQSYITKGTRFKISCKRSRPGTGYKLIAFE
jgi:hypothetical protein